jgi:hypothetical protein
MTKLQEHIRHSRAAAEANKAKGNRYVEILSSLYADSSRFIEELLQNTNDACLRMGHSRTTGKLKLQLKKNTLFLFHNGIPFDEDDLISLTTIGRSTKAAYSDVNIIGKFGLGFKSVYAVCHEPQIHSASYHFRISDFEVLEETDEYLCEIDETCIILPLKDEKGVYETVKNGLKKISFQHLLFVEGYGSVEVDIDGDSFLLKAETTTVYDRNLSIISVTDTRKERPDEFLMYTPRENAHSGLKTGFHVQRSDVSLCYTPITDNCISVFYPTLSPSGLCFLLHAAFTTTPTREQVPFDKNKTPENIQILEEITTAFARLPLLLRKHQILNSSFWAVCPVAEKEEGSLPASAVRNGLLRSLVKDAVVPSQSGKLFRLRELVAAGNDIAALLQPSDVMLLFERKDILCSDFFALVRLPEGLKGLFSALKHVDASDFAYAVGNRPLLFKRKPVSWHAAFLKLVASQQHLWSYSKKNAWFSLREKQFILLNDNSIAAPYRDDKVQISLYDPARKKIAMVHRHLMQDEELLSFLKMLEIPSPDDMKELSENVLHVFLDTHQSIRKNFNAWQRLFEFYRKADHALRTKLTEEVSQTPCIPVCSYPMKKKSFVKPSEAYFPEDDVLAFLKGTDIPMIDERLNNHLIKAGYSETEIREVLKQLGVNDLPAFFSVETVSENRFDDMRTKLTDSGFIITKETFRDFDLHGLELFFSKPDLKKSLVLAKIVTGNYPKAEMLFETYTRKETVHTEPNFIHKLSDKAWLFDADGKLKPTAEINLLHPEYRISGIDISKLSEKFNLPSGLNLVSDEEMKLILKLRNLRNNPGKSSEIMTLLNIEMPENTPQLENVEPLILDREEPLNIPAGHNENTAVTQLSFDQFAAFHTQFALQNNKWFYEHPSQKRAVNIARKVLWQMYGEENVSEKFPEEIDMFFEVHHPDGKVRKIFVSGMKTIAGMFLLPINKTLKEECVVLAVDDVFKIKPVVYIRKFQDDFEFGLVSV